LLDTNRSNLNDALGFYQQRCLIETALAYLKSKEFDLEATFLSHSNRIELLLDFLDLALL
jgi:hypothetical protein